MGNPDLLTKETRCALIDADLIIGARRMRDAIPKNCHAEYKETYDGREIMALVEETDAENIVICMSGDSGFYSFKQIHRLCPPLFIDGICPSA